MKNTNIFIETEEIKCTEEKFINTFKNFLNQDEVFIVKAIKSFFYRVDIKTNLSGIYRYKNK